MSQALGAFGLLDFTTLRGPFLLGARFDTYEPFISLIFQFFSGRVKPRILNQWIRGHECNYINPSSMLTLMVSERVS
jgi:hypothetical protein